MRLTCCVRDCENHVEVPWWRALWAILLTLSHKPYICPKHQHLFEGPGAP